MIDVRTLQATSEQRSNRWHKTGIQDWSPLEWAAAMAGEAGEACNAAKKLRRLEGDIANLDKRLALGEADEYRRLIAEEAGDTIMYAVLLISRVGHDAEDIIRYVFNTKSQEYGFPERL